MIGTTNLKRTSTSLSTNSLVVLLFCCISLIANAQFDRQLWFFGDEAANSGMIFQNSSAQPFSTNLKGLIDLSESNVMLANTSVVNFYSNGETILNNLSRPFPNAKDLKGSARSMYGSSLVDSPVSCDEFYIFYTESTDDGPSRKLYYSVIDMTIEVEDFLFTGLGDVIPDQKDIDITPPSVDIGESLYVVDKLIPKEGSWLFASDRSNQSILIFDISATGIVVHGEYVLSQISSSLPTGDFSTVVFNSHKINDKTSKLTFAPSSEEGVTGFPIGAMNFDRQTGEFDIATNVEIASNTTSTYGTAFSSDGSKFYYSDHIDKTLFQYDFNNDITTLIGTSSHNGKTGGLKRAINDEIYWAHQFSIEGDDRTIKTLSSIQQPNNSGTSCGLNFESYDINTSGLPIRIGVFPLIISEALAPKAIVVNEANCGMTDGSVSVLVDPRLEPLTYNWSDGGTDRTLENVGAGQYIVEMMSLDGCMYVDSITVTELSAFTITDISVEGKDPSNCLASDGQFIIDSPDFSEGDMIEVMYTDQEQQDFLFLFEVNNEEVIVVDNLSIGDYFNIMVRGVDEDCNIPVPDTISLIGAIETPDLGNDTLLCRGMQYLIEPASTYNSYLWSDGSNAPSITVSETGVYEVAVTNIDGCFSNNSVYVQFAENPNVSLDQVVELEFGDSTILMPSVTSEDEVSYEWSPPLGLSCSDCLSPTAKPLSNQEYFFEVFSDSDCKDSASIMVSINHKAGLIFPNTFSPNGDGTNDIFEYTVSSDEVALIRSFIIYNRWGEPTFNRQNISIDEANFGWDGTQNGTNSETGVYIFMVEVELINGDIVEDNGDVLIVR